MVVTFWQIEASSVRHPVDVLAVLLLSTPEFILIIVEALQLTSSTKLCLMFFSTEVVNTVSSSPTSTYHVGCGSSSRGCISTSEHPLLLGHLEGLPESLSLLNQVLILGGA